MYYSPLAMHIPDGFLSVAVSVVLWLCSAAAIFFALRIVSRDLGEKDIPMMGVLAAAIFAGQMLNFSVTGGTSGHLLGAALATILLGPWPAVLVMTSVVGIQALIFQDGGLLALGANLFTMAVIGPAVSYFVYTTIQKLAAGKKWGVFAGGFLAGSISVFIASLGVALMLAVSGTSPANIAVPAMAGIHTLIGIGEGLITTGALAFLFAARPDLLKSRKGTGKSTIWVGGLVIAGILAIISPLASANPDGLEWVAEEKGFIDTAQGSLYNIIPDYVVPGISNEAIATILAGLVGVLIVAGSMLAVSLIKNNNAINHGE